jgi:ribose-phosphate pyrophosphokinase
VLGDVDGKDCLLVDDMIDSGGTILKAADHLRRSGAKKVFIAASLPFFSGNAMADFDAAFDSGIFTRVIGTDAVYRPQLWEKKWFVKSSVDWFFGEVLKKLYEDAPMSDLLDSRVAIKKYLEEIDGKVR